PGGDADIVVVPAARRAGRRRQREFPVARASVGTAFDDGDELEKRGADAAQETVDIQRLLHALAGDAGERVELDLVFLENLDAAHDGVPGGLAALVHAVTVVDGARAVDAHADEEIVFLEECAPLVVEAGAVGLEGVFDDAAGAVLFLEGDRAAVELDAHERGLAALPAEDDG